MEDGRWKMEDGRWKMARDKIGCKCKNKFSSPTITKIREKQ